MKARLLIPVFLLLAAVTAWAGGSTAITLTTTVVDLPPGTRVSLRMQSRYVLLDLSSAHGGSVSADSIPEAYSLAGSGVFKWEFTVPANGHVPAQTFVFGFNKRLLSAPKGMAAVVLFPTTYTITCPAGNATCQSRTRDVSFGLNLREDAAPALSRCLQLRGGERGVFVGLGKDCSDPRATARKLRPTE